MIGYGYLELSDTPTGSMKDVNRRPGQAKVSLGPRVLTKLSRSQFQSGGEVSKEP